MPNSFPIIDALKRSLIMDSTIYFANGRHWKPPCVVAVPQVTVQMIPHDGEGNVLVMHRSPNVRSAPNCWSFPSGLHDIGETLEVGAARELLEEYGLHALRFNQLGVYENIAGDAGNGAQYHWVVVMLAVGVSNLRDFVNKEPDKHDQTLIVRADCLLRPEWRSEHPSHPSLEQWLVTSAPSIVDQLMFSPCLHLNTVNDEEHMRERCLKCCADRDIAGGPWEGVQ